MHPRRARSFHEVRRMHVPAAIVIGRRGVVRGIRMPRMIALIAVRVLCLDRQRAHGARRRAKRAVQHGHRESRNHAPCPDFARLQHRLARIIHSPRQFCHAPAG